MNIWVSGDVLVTWLDLYHLFKESESVCVCLYLSVLPYAYFLRKRKGKEKKKKSGSVSEKGVQNCLISLDVIPETSHQMN